MTEKLETFAERCRRDARLLDDLAVNHDRIAAVWSDSKHAEYAVVCRNGSSALRASADAAEEIAHDNETLERGNEARRTEREGS